jgi:hypothetical protein
MAAAAVHDTHTTANLGTALDAIPELGRYRDGQAERRLVASCDLHGGLLVIDEDHRGNDRRLIARLDPDEPAGNAHLVAELYRADPDRHARPLVDDDWFAGPSNAVPPDPGATLHAPDGRKLRLGVSDGELRWLDNGRPVSLRRVLATVESYGPVAMSERALELKPSGVRGRVLRQELERNAASPFVLNRGLREALQARLAAGETLALIAGRCGRFHRGHIGRADTSWLARRCGLMAPPGESHPTPWVHTDVLALIAREGLGVAPREVELA